MYGIQGGRHLEGNPVFDMEQINILVLQTITSMYVELFSHSFSHSFSYPPS